MRIHQYQKARLDVYPPHSYVDSYRGMMGGYALISRHARPQIIAISPSLAAIQWLCKDGFQHVPARFHSIGGTIVNATEFNSLVRTLR